MPETINGVTHPINGDFVNFTGPGAGTGDLGVLAATAGANVAVAAGAAGAAALAAANAYTDQAVSRSAISGTTVRESVATSGDLPASGNASGDARLAEDTGHFWVWDGSAWVDAGPVGVPGSDATVTDGTVAAALEGPASSAEIASKIDARTQAQASSIVGTGAGWEVADGTALGTPTHATVQAAATAAASNETRLYAAGSYTTDQTLTVTSTADLSGLTINYTGTGVAVRVGSAGAYLTSRHLSLPRIVYTNKPAVGWTAGTVGVELVNLNACPDVRVPYVNGFETGLRVKGDGGRGNAYNTVMIGWLWNNKVNQHVTAAAASWANQNTYIGGRFGHWTGEGNEVAGTAHISIDAGLQHAVNNNLWLNPSLEGDTPQWHADMAGHDNMIINGRWETVTGGVTPKVRWKAAAARNQILYGNRANQIVETFDAAAADGNVIHTASQVRISGASSKSVLLLENSIGSSTPTDVVMEAGATKSGAAPATAYTVSRGPQVTNMKRAADTKDRLRLDHVWGRVYMGPGNIDLASYIGPHRASIDGTFQTAPDLNGWAETTAAPEAGGAGALPATPAGYLYVRVNGTLRKIPYY